MTKTTTATAPTATSWQQLQPPSESADSNWDTKTILVGTAIGAVLGLGTSWLMVRTSRESRGGPPSISSGDALKVGVTAIGLMRAIAALGEK